jgi:hypothetical protein
MVSVAGQAHELSAAASKLLGDLEARNYHEDPCWLVTRTDGRLALYVPVDYSVSPERLRAVTLASVVELERRGLIQREFPARNAVTLSYRDCRDQYLGWPVRLTEDGRQRLRRWAAAP